MDDGAMIVATCFAIAAICGALLLLNIILHEIRDEIETIKADVRELRDLAKVTR